MPLLQVDQISTGSIANQRLAWSLQIFAVSEIYLLEMATKNKLDLMPNVEVVFFEEIRNSFLQPVSGMPFSLCFCGLDFC